MRLGVIGLGGIAAAHLAAWQVLQPGFDLELHGHDSRSDREVPGVTLHETLDDLLEVADVVDICTPSFTHPEIIRAAADRGRPIICEKPLALDVDTAVAALRYCRERDVPLQVGQVVRYFPEYAAARRAVSSGEYGDPAVLRFRRASPQPSSNRWMEDESLSGGITVDLMIHDIDQALWFAGDVERVFCQTTLPGAGGIATHALAILTHSSGAITHLTGSWGLARGFETSFEIAGTQGMLHHDSTDHPSVRADRDGLLDGAGLLPAMAGASPFVAELRELLASVAYGAAARVDPTDAVRALSVAIALRTSAKSGRPEVPQPLPPDLPHRPSEWTQEAAATW